MNTDSIEGRFVDLKLPVIEKPSEEQEATLQDVMLVMHKHRHYLEEWGYLKFDTGLQLSMVTPDPNFCCVAMYPGINVVAILESDSGKVTQLRMEDRGDELDEGGMTHWEQFNEAILQALMAVYTNKHVQ